MNYLDYLQNERKLKPETISQFKIGCMDEHGAYHQLSNEFPTKFLPNLGFYFRHSILYPVYDLYNKPVAISARRLDGTEPKSINTVYLKKNHLYGLNWTYRDILEKQEAFVVEGNVDFLQLYQNGIRNVVALLGSNLSTRHICLLSRFAKKLLIVPDPDGGGDKFKARALDLLKKSGIDFEFIELPRSSGKVEKKDSYDPDKFVKEFGAEKFLALRKMRV